MGISASFSEEYQRVKRKQIEDNSLTIRSELRYERLVFFLLIHSLSDFLNFILIEHKKTEIQSREVN